VTNNLLSFYLKKIIYLEASSVWGMVNSPLSSKLQKAVAPVWSNGRPFSSTLVFGVRSARSENVSSTVGFSSAVVEFRFSSSVKSMRQSSRLFFEDSGLANPDPSVWSDSWKRETRNYSQFLSKVQSDNVHCIINLCKKGILPILYNSL